MLLRRPAPEGTPAPVERRRLMAVLSDSGPPAVVVASGPAGSGKSMLAVQWVATDPRPSATVRLLPYMDDPVVLADQLICALEALGSQAPQTRTAITASEPEYSATLLPGLTRLASSRDGHYVLVIDDVHVLQSAGSERVLAAVCEGVPDGSTVFLLTRARTPHWLARTRANGLLLELTSGDLAFDRDEGATLLAGLGLEVGAPEVAEIVAHTEGWAVGMYLTALAMAAGPSARRPPGLPPGGASDRFVAEYLREEVLQSLSGEQREFMMRTSILEDLNGPLCDAVLDRSDSAAVLADLHQRLQLIVETDVDHTYRYHHLLADALTEDLLTLDPSAIPGLHEGAARWYDAQEDRDRAVRHATASGNTALVSELVWPEVARYASSGRLDRLPTWLAELTERQIQEDRWLTLAAAWVALQQGDGTAMMHWVLTAERHAGRSWRADSRTETYAANVALMFALIGSGGLADTRDLSERALTGLEPDNGFRSLAAFLRGVVLTLERDLEAAVRSLTEADHLARSLNVPIIEADAKSWLGMLAIFAGDRDRGIRLISEATDVIRRNNLDRLASSAHCLTAQALVLAMRGDKKAAATGLAKARRLSGLIEEIAPWFAVVGRLVQARTAILLGDGATARLLIAEAKQAMTPDLLASSASDSLKDAEDALGQLSIDGVSTRPLTAAELRILQFLPSHLTIPQIGEHLFLSQATVKTHVLSIYRKFGVASRGEAVIRARTLGLIEAPLTD
jgi:LuxR family maltose regulon positive regulatory protein